MDTALDVNKAIAAISKGAEKKSDAMMLMSPENNWEQYLIPAPLSIALLGELLLISAETDFSLSDHPPKDGFKLIKYPNSFRATLVQISNSGWDAFNEAHTSMTQIHLHSGNVDTHIKNCVKFLMQGTPEEVKVMVPMSLKNVQYIAEESLKLAVNIETKFVDVMLLTAEVLEACTSTKGVHEQKVKKTEIAIAVAKYQKQAAEEEKKENKRRSEMIEKQVQDAQEDYHESLKNMPTGFQGLALAVGEALLENTRSITSFAQFIISPMTYVAKQAKEQTTDMGEDASDDLMVQEQNYSNKHIYTKIPPLSIHVGKVFQIATGGKQEGSTNASPNFQNIADGDVIFYKKLIKKMRSAVAEEKQTDLQKTVLDIFDKVVNVCDELQNLTSALVIDDKENRIKSIVDSLKAVRTEIDRLNVKAKKTQRRSPIEGKSPHIAKMNETHSTSAIKSTIELARYKTKIATATLKDAKFRQDKATKESKKSFDKMTKILADMEKMGVQKIDFDKIRNTLVKGIDALAKVREQWGKLVRFFQMLSNLIKCCLHTSLSSFVEQTNAARKLQMAGQPIKVLRDTIFEEASRAGQVAYVVHTISGAYVDISDKHLMDRITSLGRLISLDPKTDIDEIKLKRKELHNGCADAQKAIQDIVKKEKEEFHRNIDARIAQIEALDKKLPPIEPERQAQIENDVACGMTDEEVDNGMTDEEVDNGMTDEEVDNGMTDEELNDMY